jgi:hypothetical protein
MSKVGSGWLSREVGIVGGSGRGSGKERSHRAGWSRLDRAANTEIKFEYKIFTKIKF